MCNLMVSYFKRNSTVQRNKRQSRYEQVDRSRLEQTDKNIRGAIRVEHIRDGSSILDQKYLRRMVTLEHIGGMASGEKRGRSERS